MKGHTVTEDGNAFDWRARAACQDYNPEWWFPTGAQYRARRREDPWRLARSVCVRCPVIEACLRHVLHQPEPEGMWAGLTPDQRQALTRPLAEAS
jgi:WhiB family transcriptional regulator, redox-sensing transcriptional regulator